MLLRKKRLVLLQAVLLMLLLSACPFNPPNKIPVWFLPIGDQTVEETKTLDILLSDHVTDEDGNALSFSVTGKGSVVGGLYSYTPGIGESAVEFEQEAVYAVTITADDGKGGTASESFSVTVMPTNRPQSGLPFRTRPFRRIQLLQYCLQPTPATRTEMLLHSIFLKGPVRSTETTMSTLPPMRMQQFTLKNRRSTVLF